MPPKLKSQRVAAVGFALAAMTTITLAGCASARARANSGPPHPVDVEVNNNLALPTDLTVYLAGLDEGRRILGSVPPGKTKTLRFTPSSYSQPYRLIATQPLRRDVVSQPFTVGSGMTGRLVWTLVPNIIGFEDVDTADTTVVK